MNSYKKIFVFVLNTILFVVLLRHPTMAESNNYRASEAPPYFVTQNYSLIFHIPSKLFRCSIPPQNIGSDNGVVIYLTRPYACSKETFSAIGPGSKNIPKITVFYSYNVVPISINNNSTIPENNSQLMTEYCATPIKESSSFTLFGKQPIACIKNYRDKIEFMVGSLYSQNQASPGDVPDSLVTIELDTPKNQFHHELKNLSIIAGSLQICQVGRSDPPGKYLQCPAHSNW